PWAARTAARQATRRRWRAPVSRPSGADSARRPQATRAGAETVQRRVIRPRAGWEKTVEEQGLIYQHTNGGVDWDESAFYAFTRREIDELEAATNEIQRIALEAGQHIIDQNRFAEFGIPAAAADAIVWAWNAEPPAIYGRLDLAYDGGHQ